MFCVGGAFIPEQLTVNQHFKGRDNTRAAIPISVLQGFTCVLNVPGSSVF